jgi:multiple sugar transport system substrate-binding protein
MRTLSRAVMLVASLMFVFLIVLASCLPEEESPMPEAQLPPAATERGPLNPTRTLRPRTPTPTSDGATATPICIDCYGDPIGDPGDTVVKWFVGLGTGTDLPQVEVEQEVVNTYNSTNDDDIYIALNVIPNAEAYNVLATQIAAGTPPDIIGPVGIRGISFAGDDLLPLDDLIKEQDVDLSAYDEGALSAYRNEQGELLALPYAVYPSFIYFNKDLFDAAGLAYPPQQFGEQYEGKPWDMDALRELGMRLTLDANGKNATEPNFDAKKIVQFGFIPQWQGNALNEGAFFGAGDLTADDNSATIPPAWKDSWRWFYQARHVDHFVPDATYENADAFGQGNVWSTGKVAMAWTHLWYTCCFDSSQVPRWDIAVVPSYNGTTTAKLHADTFAILKETRDPDAAFKVYMFLLQNEELRALYGGLPAITAEEPAYFATLNAKFALVKANWQVALDSLAYADVPSHEQYVPNYLKFQDRLAAFDQLVNATPGLDLGQEIDKLEADLTAIFQAR